MPKPIIVGYDPKSSDPSPVAFALRAARFTGAPLVVASVGSGARGARRARRGGPASHAAGGALEELQRDLDAEGVAVENVELKSSSAARALHEAAEERDAGLLVVGSTTAAPSDACCPGPRPSGSCTARRARSRSSRTDGRPAGASTRSASRSSTPTKGTRRCAAPSRLPGVLARRYVSSPRSSPAFAPRTAAAAGRRRAARQGETDVEGELRVRAEGELDGAIAALGDDVAVESDAFVEDPADVLIAVSQNLDLLSADRAATGRCAPSCWAACRVASRPRRTARSSSSRAA